YRAQGRVAGCPAPPPAIPHSTAAACARSRTPPAPGTRGCSPTDARRADRLALVPLSFHKDGSPFEHALLDYSRRKRSPPRSRQAPGGPATGPAISTYTADIVASGALPASPPLMPLGCVMIPCTGCETAPLAPW